MEHDVHHLKMRTGPLIASVVTHRDTKEIVASYWLLLLSRVIDGGS